jgi:hypothetical protein
MSLGMVFRPPLRALRRLALAGLILAAPAAGHAGPAPTRLDIDYRFYFGGLDLFQMDVAAEMAPDSYRLDTFMRTQGVADTFIRSEIRSNVEGRIDAGAPHPVRFSSSYDGTFGPRSVRMVYDGGGPAEVEAQPADPADDREAVPDDMRRGTVDPLTASLISAIAQSAEVSGAATSGPPKCPGTIPIFDGRRRYDISFTYEGEDELATSNEAAYSGPATICRLETKRIAGFSRSWERQEAKDPPPPPKLWLARVGPEGLVLPVRLVAKTRWGTAVAHLERLDREGQTVLAPAAEE